MRLLYYCIGLYVVALYGPAVFVCLGLHLTTHGGKLSFLRKGIFMYSYYWVVYVLVIVPLVFHFFIPAEIRHSHTLTNFPFYTFFFLPPNGTSLIDSTVLNEIENEYILANAIAVPIGLTILIGWYSLQLYDRKVLEALIRGWWGVIWSQSPVIIFLMKALDLVVHFILPIYVAVHFVPHVQPWMAIPALINTRIWCLLSGLIKLKSEEKNRNTIDTSSISRTTLRSLFFPAADDIYCFTPKRSGYFWEAAYKIELLLNLTVPFLCSLCCLFLLPPENRSQHRLGKEYFNEKRYSFPLPYIFSATAVVGFCGLFWVISPLIRSFVLPKLQDKATKLMTWLVEQGDSLNISEHLIIRDNDVWLNWLCHGMYAIGETYVSLQWDLNLGGNEKTLDQVLIDLLSLPVVARRTMFQSWEARIVAFLARIIIPSQAVVHSNTTIPSPIISTTRLSLPLFEQYEISMNSWIWRKILNGPEDVFSNFFHSSFGMFNNSAVSLKEANVNKLKHISEQIGLKAGMKVLMISSMEGIGLHLARDYDVKVTMMVKTKEDLIFYEEMALQLGLSVAIVREGNEATLNLGHSYVELILAKDLPTFGNALKAKKMKQNNNQELLYDAGLSINFIDTLPPNLLPYYFEVFTGHLSDSAVLLIDLVGQLRDTQASQTWVRHYISSESVRCVRFRMSTDVSTQIRDLLAGFNFDLISCENFTEDYSRTLLAWQQNLRDISTVERPGYYPESFERTLSFYFLHQVAYLRTGGMQCYQLQCIRSGTTIAH